MSVSRSQNMVGVSLMFNRGLLISLCLSISLGQEYSYFFENDDLEIPDNNTLNPSSGITIEAWVSPSFTGAIDDFTGIAHYLTLNGPTQESGFSLMYYDGAWRFIVSVGSGDHDIYGDGLEVWPGIDLDIDTWTHIAGTYDNTSNEAKIYKNGQLQETFTTESGDLNWDFINIDYMIGKGVDPGSNESFFKGNIDEIRLWDVARDETALIADMNGPLVGNENNLIGYWNFDEDTTDATINDITANNNDGTLNQVDGYWDTDVFTELQCEDYVISELPFYHSDTTTGQGDDWNSTGFNDSLDIAYKLTLTEKRTLYIDTCDSLTNFDTILYLKSACFANNSITEYDDGPDGWCTEVDPEVLPQSYPSIIDTITLNPGTYFIIVDGFSPTSHGTYGLAVGVIPEIISSSIASDDSYIEIRFNDPIYTESNGTGAANLSDFEISFDQNGGNATNVQFTSMTNVDGGSLLGGEDTIRFNISVTGTSSGVETVTINPATSSSVFNTFGIGLSSESSVIQNLNDYFPPVANFNPADGDTIWLSDNLIIDFGEEIKLADGNEATNENIDALLSLVYTSNQQPIPFDATINTNKEEITVDPNSSLVELTNIQLSFDADSFTDDFGNLVLPASATLFVSDATAPEVTEATLSNNNTFVSIIFSEGVYTNSSGNGGLNTGDFEITFNQNGGDATDATISNITNNSGSVPAGGETELKIIIDVDGIPNGVESILITPANNNSIYDSFGNALTAAQNTVILSINDKLAPTITSDPEDGTTNVLETTNITFTYTETVTFINGSDVTNTLVDSLITLKENNANGANISFDATINANKNVITVNPNANFTSWQLVYTAIASGLVDSADNLASAASTSFRSRDATPPTTTHAILDYNNNYVDFIISESVFGNNDGTGAVEIGDLNITFNQNSGNATSAFISSLSNTTNNQLSGGEDTLRVHLSIDGAASGVETIEIVPLSNSVFDIGGNSLPITETSDELNLYDLLVPSVETVSLDNRQNIDFNTSTNIVYTFSEPLTTIEYSVSARHYQLLDYSAVTNTPTTELTITLNPPLKALDTIDIDILEIIDNAGHSTVDLLYEYFTPALADYDWNDTIDIKDLTNFIKGWRDKDYAKELGPVKGKIPHYLPEFDSEFGLDDGMVFTQMWGWAQDNFGFDGVSRPPVGDQPDWSARTITIPQGTMSGQVFVKYDPADGQIEITQPAYGANGISLKYKDEQTGKYLVEFGSFAEVMDKMYLSVLPIMNHPAYITVAHIFYDESGSVISSGTKQINVTTPSKYKLYPNYPNPFNPNTTIRYAISEPGLVAIDIYDINGRLVKNLVRSEMEPGFYDIKWNAGNYSSGIYFCRLTTENNVLTSKLLLVK